MMKTVKRVYACDSCYQNDFDGGPSGELVLTASRFPIHTRASTRTNNAMSFSQHCDIKGLHSCIQLCREHAYH